MARLLAPVLMLALAACSAEPVPQGPAVEVISGAAPALKGETVTGESLAPEDHEGRVLVVNLWATWCEPCEREQPVLVAAHEDAGPGGPSFLGIDVRDDPSAARAWIERFGVGYPSLSDPSGYLQYRFGAPFLPATIVVDADGRLRFRVVGEIDRATLDRLVADASSPAT